MMKNLSLLSLLILATALLTMTSCGDDDSGTTIVLGPTVELLMEAGFISADANVAPGDEFTVRLNAQKGDNPLRAMTVYEDGVAIDLNRVQVDGAPAGANPKLITGTDVDGLTWDVTVTAHTDGATRTYEFEIQDEGNNVQDASINITTDATPPSITTSGSGTFNDIATSSLVSVPITVNAGSGNLSTIAVFENATLMDADRLFYNDVNVAFTANPETFPTEDQLNFDGEILIRSNDAAGTNGYTIEVTDENGETATLDITINTGTPIDQEFTALLLVNADGPDPEGGLDLDNGTTVSVNSAEAEIVDKGIDLSLPASDNWLQQIEAANGAELRVPDLTVSENFTYEGATSKEAIRAAFDSGIAPSDQKVVVDDLFLVKRGDDHFLLKVVEVSPTNNNNEDFYRFDVKQALQ
ncbi:MAG: hypothetical protein AAFP19_20330 [Bacteroidota bacterium]